MILVYTLYNILKRILIIKNIPRQLQLISITTEGYLNKEMGFLRLPLLLITTFSVRIKYIRNITFIYFLDMHILHTSRNWSNNYICCVFPNILQDPFNCSQSEVWHKIIQKISHISKEICFKEEQSSLNRWYSYLY